MRCSRARWSAHPPSSVATRRSGLCALVSIASPSQHSPSDHPVHPLERLLVRKSPSRCACCVEVSQAVRTSSQHTYSSAGFTIAPLLVPTLLPLLLLFAGISL